MKNYPSFTAISLIAACTMTAPLCGQGEAAESSALKHRPAQKWDVILPSESWRPVSSLDVPHDGEHGFHAEKDGLSLSVDTNADGVLDKKIKGTKGFLVLKGKHVDGSALHYGIRVRLAGNRYEYSASGAMTGSVRGVSLKLIDQNNNGIYNEYGVDAMVVGKSKAACFLSSIVNLKGELYELSVAEDGQEVTTTPWTGETGTLNLRKGLRIPGKLRSAVVSSDGHDRAMSFQLAGNPNGLKVPVGSYRLTGGFAEKGGDTAMLRHGVMEALEVSHDSVTAPTWGAPLVAEFDFTRDGGEVTVQPKVRFLGRGGEEWHTLLPDAKSPKLAFYDKKRNKLLATKRFEGC